MICTYLSLSIAVAGARRKEVEYLVFNDAPSARECAHARCCAACWEPILLGVHPEPYFSGCISRSSSEEEPGRNRPHRQHRLSDGLRPPRCRLTSTNAEQRGRAGRRSWVGARVRVNSVGTQHFRTGLNISRVTSWSQAGPARSSSSSPGACHNRAPIKRGQLGFGVFGAGKGQDTPLPPLDAA